MEKSGLTRVNNIRSFVDFKNNLEREYPIASKMNWLCENPPDSTKIFVGLVREVNNLVRKRKPGVGHRFHDILVCVIRGLTGEGEDIGAYRVVFYGDIALKVYKSKLLKGDFIAVLNPSRLKTVDYLPSSYCVASRGSAVWVCSMMYPIKKSSNLSNSRATSNFDSTRLSKELVVNNCLPTTSDRPECRKERSSHCHSVSCKCQNHCNICPHLVHNNSCVSRSNVSFCNASNNTCVSSCIGQCHHTFFPCRNACIHAPSGCFHDNRHHSQNIICPHNSSSHEHGLNHLCLCNQTVHNRCNRSDGFLHPSSVRKYWLKERSSSFVSSPSASNRKNKQGNDMKLFRHFKRTRHDPFVHSTPVHNSYLKQKRRNLCESDDWQSIESTGLRNSVSNISPTPESSCSEVTVTSLLDHINSICNNKASNPVRIDSGSRSYKIHTSMSSLHENSTIKSNPTAEESMLVDSFSQEEINKCKVVEVSAKSNENNIATLVSGVRSPSKETNVNTDLVAQQRNNKKKVRKLLWNDGSDIFYPSELSNSDETMYNGLQKVARVSSDSEPPSSPRLSTSQTTVVKITDKFETDTCKIMISKMNPTINEGQFSKSNDPNVLINSESEPCKLLKESNVQEDKLRRQSVIDVNNCTLLETQTKEVINDLMLGEEVDTLQKKNESKTKKQLSPSDKCIQPAFVMESNNDKEQLESVVCNKPKSGVATITSVQKLLEKIENVVDVPCLSISSPLFENGILDNASSKIPEELDTINSMKEETFEGTQPNTVANSAEELTSLKLTDTSDGYFPTLDQSILKFRRAKNFVLDACLVDVKPSFVEGRLFDLVSGHCPECHSVTPFSQLVRPDVTSLKCYCLVCYNKGKTFKSKLLYFFSLLAAASNSTFQIIATGEEAESITGVPVNKYLSNESSASKCWDKLKLLISPKNNSSPKKWTFSVSILCLSLGSRAVPVLSSNITPNISTS